MSVIPFLELLEQFAHENFPDEMEDSRTRYLKTLGLVHESEESYDENMRAFLDWFVFERPLNESEKTPLELFVERGSPEMSEEDLEIFKGFRRSAHSLYLIKKVTSQGVDCKDLFSGEKIVVSEEISGGFLKGEIFESRIFPWQESYRFGEMFRFHPKRANKVIQKAAKQILQQESETTQNLMMKLATMKIKHQRYPRVDLLEFYKEALLG